MEKIQTAIAKARAARDLEAGGAQKRPASEAVGAVQTSSEVAANPVPETAVSPDPGPDPEKVAAAWAALKEITPDPRILARHRVVASDGGFGTREVDIVRTRLLQQIRANGWRRIAITSPGTGCGKSTLAANLGFSLGRQRDQRTIVAEMDMRRPSLARLLGIRDRLNFSRVLDGQGDFLHHSVRIGPSLAFAACHDVVRHPAELLQSGEAVRALDTIEATYAPTVFLFDMPPLLVNDDAMAFMGQVDCALLIAAAEKTTIREIDTCERMIAAQTNVMGVVLNKCRYMPEEEKYGY
jgi:Mrp family chromosome partitioning ATPase